MRSGHHLDELLNLFSRQGLDGDRVSDEQLSGLLKLCSHPAQTVRERALSLLLDSFLSEGIGALRRLIDIIVAEHTRAATTLPLPLLEILVEVVSYLETVPGEPRTAERITRILQHIPQQTLRKLFENPHPLLPFITLVRGRSLVGRGHSAPRSFDRRWRLFQKRLRSSPPLPPWAQLTLADLRLLWQKNSSGRSFPFSKGRWRTVLRPLCFPVRSSPPASGPFTLQAVSRRGSDKQAHHVWERLLQRQTEELRSVRALAFAAGESTRRVVLSWHNATLAAAGGWAFESLSGMFPSKALWGDFRKAVEARMQALESRQTDAGEAIERLWELWEKRLIVPKVRHALWERVSSKSLGAPHPSAALCPLTRTLFPEMGEKGSICPQACRGEEIRSPAAGQREMRSLDLETLLETHGESRYGWPGALSPHQRANLHDILTWRAERQRLWREGLIRLAALLSVGQEFMDEGSLPRLVLPWIDKFFISSRREDDWPYLCSLLEWMESQGTQPLILFWEDTAHAQAPSFQLVLDRLYEKGYPYRGIGIFDRLGSKRQDALRIIGDEHRWVRLFALRPQTDIHNPQSLDLLLRNKDLSFFEAYDSSWKDNLCFLYAGTQVFPLLSIQSEMESFAAWTAFEHTRIPFGAGLRKRLRHAMLAQSASIDDAFSRRYALWANLC